MKNALPSAARVIVIGTSATGKSTFAQQLATIKSMPLVQLDPLFWDKDWTPKPKEEFIRLIEAATAQNEWLVDGNYGAVREQLWSKANVVIWLNYSLPVVLWRGLKRTVKRVISQQELWHGNKESFRRSFLSRESILVWILTTHARRTREFEALKASGEYTLEWIEFKHPRQAKQWLANRAKAA
jgi:adenylate kinase family enzyme